MAEPMTVENVLKPWGWVGQSPEAPLHLPQPSLIEAPDVFRDVWNDAQRDWMFAVMALTPQHTYQILTKRPERMAEYCANPTMPGRIYRVISDWLDDGEAGILGSFWDEAHNITGWRTHGGETAEPEWNLPLPNVWLGVSVEDQQSADERIPRLLRCPAKLRYIDAVLWGPVDFQRLAYGSCRLIDCLSGDLMTRPDDESEDDPQIYAAAPSSIDWLILSGESGPDAAPCNIEWIRSAAAQARAANVPVFVPQLGSRPFAAPTHDGGTGHTLPIKDPCGGDMAEWPADLRLRQLPGQGR